MKKALFVLVAILAVAFMANTAHAVPQLTAAFAAGVGPAVAIEKIPAAGKTVPGTLTFQPNVALAANQQVKLTLTNGTFPVAVGGTAINLCREDAGPVMVTIGTGTAASGATTVTIFTGATGITKVDHTFQTGACAAAPANNTFPVVISQVSAATDVTVAIDDPLAPGNANVAKSATYLSIKRQFSMNATTGVVKTTSTLDFATAFKSFVLNAPTTPTTSASDAATIINSDETIDDKVATQVGGGACLRTLLAADASLKFDMTGDFSGITTINYAGVSIAPTIAGTSATATIAGTAARICRSGDAVTATQLELGANGTTAMNTGTFTTSMTIVPVAGGAFSNTNQIPLITGATSHEFTTTAASVLLPHLTTNGNGVTACIISNKGATSAPIKVDVLTVEGAAALPASVTIGNVASKASSQVTFSGPNVQLLGGVAFPLAIAGGNTRYSARVSVNSPVADVLINCVQQDPNAPTAARRLLPTFQTIGGNNIN